MGDADERLARGEAESKRGSGGVGERGFRHFEHPVNRISTLTGERERETERQTDRQTDRQRQTKTKTEGKWG